MSRTLFLVHGMGVSGENASAWSAPWEAALRKLMAHYKSRAGITFPDDLILAPITYGDALDQWRDRWNKAAGDIEKQLGDNGISAPKGLDSALAALKKAGKGQFFWTHWMQVILFRFSLIARTEVLARVTSQLQTQITEARAKDPFATFHVLAHSLGTAVIQQTLQRMADPKVPPAEGGFAGLFTISSLFMVANVSRTLSDPPDDVYSSLASPQALGVPPDRCVQKYVDVRHHLDPIPQVIPFEPKWALGNLDFDPVEFSEFYDLKDFPSVVHNMLHYLKSPALHQRLLSSVFTQAIPTGTPIPYPAVLDSAKIDGWTSDLDVLRKSFPPTPSILDFLKSGTLLKP